jgi:ribose 5-phosphate isomerase B
MKIAIGADHGGFDLKEEIKEHFKPKGIEFIDVGTYSKASCDYPDIAEKAAKEVLSGNCELGILICGTGIGISISANKIPGIRCAHCHDTTSAKLTRLHNDANMLSMGGRIIGAELAKDIVEAFLNSPFSFDERHQRRIGKITEIEKKYLKEGL